MKKSRLKSLLILAAVVGLFFAPGLALIQTTHAQTIPTPPTLPGSTPTGITIPGANPAATVASAQPPQSNSYACGITTIGTCIFYTTSYFISYIAGFFIAFAIWMVQLGLQFGYNVFNSPVVTIGFGISLALANLGFVLGIIIIAIATILQNSTYGIKQLLWKLVVMAILVNFGLVITAPIVSFSNSLSNTFLNGMDGGAAQGNILAMSNGFAKTLAGTFSIQNLAQTPSSGDLSNKIASVTFMKAVMTLIFDAFFSFIIIIALLALAALLLVRYVYLGILLVLLPFAWLMWIFPTYKNEFSKWWNNFIKWTFFPAVALFFIYLAIQTASNSIYQTSVGTSSTQINAAQQSQQDPSSAMAQDMNTGGANGQPGVIQIIADDILLCALMIGGLFAAASLTGKAGGFVVSQAKGVSKAVGGYAGKLGKKGARAGYQKVDKGVGAASKRFGGTGAGITERLQASRIRPLATIGRGISGISSNVALVDEAKKGIPSNPEEIRTRLRGSMNKENQFAHIAKLVEMGELKGDETVNGQNVKDFMDANDKSGVIKRYGQGKMQADANKTMGSDTAMRDAERAITKAGTNTAGVADAMKSLDAATRQFVEKLTKTDIGKMNVNDVLGQNTPLSKAITKGLMLSAPQLIPSAMAKMKSTALNRFESQYKTAHDDELGRITDDSSLSDAQKDTQLTQLQDKLDKFRKALGNNALGYTSEPAATGATATPPPPSPGGAPRP